MHADASTSNASSSSNPGYGTTISIETLKIFAECQNIRNLSDSSGKILSEDVTLKVKHVIQDAVKFMTHSKRTKLTTTDIDKALNLNKVPPQYGFSSSEYIPFRFAAGGGRELYFTEEKQVNLAELQKKMPIKFPFEPTLRCHWLAINGVQPTVPENPPPVPKSEQFTECVNPVAALKDKEKANSVLGKRSSQKEAAKLKHVETAYIKQLVPHELGVEQQLYYQEITEACVGADNTKRTEALQSLSKDAGLHVMLPRICTFIAEGVKLNIIQHNLALLIYLMRMVRALIENPDLCIERYLHELIPPVISCIVSKQLCSNPVVDNHWSLRDYSSKIVSLICKNYNSTTNLIQQRISRVFSEGLTDETKHLPALYGSIIALVDLGPMSIRTHIMPKTKAIFKRLEQISASPTVTGEDKVAIDKIRDTLQKISSTSN